MKKILVLLLPVLLFAKEPSPFCSGVGVGYRQDGHTFQIFEEQRNTVDNKYESLKVPMLEGFMKLFFFNFQFDLVADIGWVMAGHMETTLKEPLSNGFQLAGHYHTNIDSGLILDGTSSLRYEFTILSDRSLLLIPLAGYGVHYQGIHHKESEPQPFQIFNVGIANSIADLSVTFQTLKRTWYGPFIGFSLSSLFLNRYQFEAGYAYHFLYLRQNLKYSEDLFGFVPGVGTFTSEVVDTDTRMRTSGSYGQQVKALFIYHITDHWSLSLIGDYYYFTTKVRKISEDNIETDNLMVPPAITVTNLRNDFNGRWRTYSLFINLLYYY